LATSLGKNWEMEEGQDNTQFRQRLGGEEFGIIVYLISNTVQHTQIQSAE
jgi:hypothetical protein